MAGRCRVGNAEWGMAAGIEQFNAYDRAMQDRFPLYQREKGS